MNKEKAVFTGEEIAALDFIDENVVLKAKNDIPDKILKKLDKYKLIASTMYFNVYLILCLTNEGKTLLKDAKKSFGVEK